MTAIRISFPLVSEPIKLLIFKYSAIFYYPVNTAIGKALLHKKE